MRTDLPESHVQESMKLEALGYVDLIELRMFHTSGNVTLYLTGQVDRVWQGKTWEGWAYSISESSQSVTGEMSRPKFTVVNPEGVFSKYALQGYLENALVTRYRVLVPDVVNNVNSFQRNVWRVSKIVSVGKTLVSCEMRGAIDGHNFFFPTRTYRPPEFPAVSI
jgi:phage-related protein